jgi:6-phosphogluconolactonase
MRYKTWLSLMLFGILCTSFAQDPSTIYLFVGSYTNGQPDTGIYIYDFNPETGQSTPTGMVDNITNPSFLTISPNGQFLYACTETKLPYDGSVTAFQIDSVHGKVTIMNQQPSGGENPVYLTVHHSGRYVVNGNYTGGSVSVFTTHDDGSLNPASQIVQFSDSSINPLRQEKSHIHAAVFSPDYNYMFFPDLGADKIRIFQFDTTQAAPLIALDSLAVKTTPGSGPRHFTFHPSKPYAYCVEELSGTISAYAYHNGQLDSIQRIFAYSTVQDTYGSADIHISPDGLFLYASNRWVEENTIAIFSINQTSGLLTTVGHTSTYGDHPRNFTIDPTGNFLLVANQVTNNIVVFKRDLLSGLLTKTEQEIMVPNPSCLQMRAYGN